MNKYKDNYEFYQSVFDEVHASDELMRKVQSMENTKAKKKVYAIRKVIYIAAAIMIMLVASNAVAYAATGETWVEQIMVHVTMNGEKQDVVMDKTVNENGDVSYEMEVDQGDVKQGFYFELSGDEEINDGDEFEIQTNTNAVLTEEDGKVYFDWPIMDVKIDITDDFKDGEARVVVAEQDGKELVATVTGTVDQYSISIAE